MGKRLCLGCMREVTGAEQVCPVCGYRHGVDDGEEYTLRPGTVLNKLYLVGKVIGQGGFGITYIGYDFLLERKVAIKEYFPMATGLVTRSNRTNVVWSKRAGTKDDRERGYENFLKEARKMAKLEQISAVVSVRSLFTQNETAYIVMDFIEGSTLKNHLMKRGTMSFDDCVKLLTPVMEALEAVHQEGIIHRDISPDNMMLRPNGKVALLDLGAAKDITIQHSDGTVSSQLVAKHGFSPPEQYVQGGKIGSWTDVYAICATIYYCVTGKVPPKSTDRMYHGGFNIQPPLTQAQFDILERGMALYAEDRIQTIGELLEALKPKEASIVPVKGNVPKPILPTAEMKAKKPAKKLPPYAIAAAVSMLIALAAVAYAWNTLKKAEQFAIMQTPAVETAEVTSVPPTEVPVTEGTDVPNPEGEPEEILVPDTEPLTEAAPRVYTMRRAENWDELRKLGYVLTRDAPFWGQTVFWRSDVEYAVFHNTMENAPKNAFDVSERGDCSILAWIDSGTLHVAANGKIAFNQDASFLFYGFENLQSIDFGGCVDTSQVTTMKFIFSECGKLTALDLSEFDTSNAKDMHAMFARCSGLTSLDFSGFNTCKVEYMTAMFADCDSLTALDISCFDSRNVKYMTEMFRGCDNLTTIICNDERILSQAEGRFQHPHAAGSGCIVDTDCGCRIGWWIERNDLSLEELTEFRAAREALWDYSDEGIQPLDLFYFISCRRVDPLVMTYNLRGDEACFDAAETHVASANEELPVRGDEEILVMQFVDGAWSEIETEVTERGILFNADTGFFAVFVK